MSQDVNVLPIALLYSLILIANAGPRANAPLDALVVQTVHVPVVQRRAGAVEKNALVSTFHLHNMIYNIMYL